MIVFEMKYRLNCLGKVGIVLLVRCFMLGKEGIEYLGKGDCVKGFVWFYLFVWFGRFLDCVNFFLWSCEKGFSV